MSRIKKSLFADCETAEQFATALQKRLASGRLTVAEQRAAELLAHLRGWDTAPKPTGAEALNVKSPAAQDVSAPTLPSGWGWGSDGVWHDGFKADQLVAELARLEVQFPRGAVCIRTPNGREWAVSLYDSDLDTIEGLSKLNAPRAKK